METKTEIKAKINTTTSKMEDEKPRGIYDDKPGRLIVRNLQYDIKQKHLKQAFGKWGNIIDVNVPLNNESNLNKGFGFIEFKTKDEARKAIENMNAKTYKGRVIAVDFAMSKRQYTKKIDQIIEKNPLKTKTTKGKADKDKATEEVGSDTDSWVGGTEKENNKEKTSKKNKKEDDTTSKEKEDLTKKDKKRIQKNRKKYENDVKEGLTLFIRNIDYTTTETELRDFFEQHGEVYFVRLVKSRVNPEAHKGSAFVKFKDSGPVERLAKLSADYWGEEKHKSTQHRLIDLESQLEFKGRRLVIFKAESKDDRKKKVEESKVKVDKRNVDMIKVGLVGTYDFVHGPVNEEDMATRIRLYKEKLDAVKKNPNLFVSKTRMCLRNIDKRMNEKHLAEFCSTFRDDWKKTLTPEALKSAERIKLIHQYKILEDKNKTDSEGKAKSSGIGFIEVANPELAMYILNSTNNFIMNEKKPKGLIVDFALEDHRKLLKRKQKMEGIKKKQREAKAEKDAEEEGLKKKTRKERKMEKNVQTIDQIGKNLNSIVINYYTEDLEKLKKLMKETNSRGKRNRIKKRIQKLNGELPEAKLTSQKEKTSVKKPSKKASKKQKTQEAEENEEEKGRNGSKNIQFSKETKKLLNIRNKSKDQIIEDEIKAEAKNKRKKKQK